MYFIVHHVPGRLRLRGFPLKRNESEAARITTLLAQCEGVHHSQASTLTGSIIIHYDTTLITSQGILMALNQLWKIEVIADRAPMLSSAGVVSALAPTPMPARARSSGIVANFSAALGKMLLEMAVERLMERSVFALVKALV